MVLARLCPNSLRIVSYLPRVPYLPIVSYLPIVPCLPIVPIPMVNQAHHNPMVMVVITPIRMEHMEAQITIVPPMPTMTTTIIIIITIWIVIVITIWKVIVIIILIVIIIVIWLRIRK